MNTKTTIPISEARKNIFDIAEEVQKPNNYYTFTENGKPKAVLMSAEEFESWQETLAVSRQFSGLKKESAQAWKQYQRGDCISLEDFLSKKGFVVRDKGTKKYAVSTPARPKGAKRVRARS